MLDTLPTDRNDHTFTAVTMPLFDGQGREVPSHIQRAVVRDDTQEVIATCGPAFHPVQHRDIVAPVLDFFKDNGYELTPRAHSQRSLYDLKGQKGCFVQSGFANNGAVMRTDIVCGDFINPTGSTSYLQQGEDTMLFKVSIFNSHDSSLAVRVTTSYERLLCMNGMTSPSFSANVYGKHTSGFNMKATAAKIENAMGAMHEDADKFGRWAAQRITRDQAVEMLKLTIAKLPNKPTGEAHFSEQLLNQIMEQFAREDQTAWGLFQAITHWQTHGKTRENANRLSVTVGRETRVAKMLNSQHWGDLCGAA